jgi:hypothetical protein
VTLGGLSRGLNLRRAEVERGEVPTFGLMIEAESQASILE